MHSPSTLTKNTATASTLPYDILEEIFFQCLPEFPLDEIQPNVKIAPMLLCHICSSWRTAALAYPPIWRHLRYRLPIRWQEGQPIVWNSTTFFRDMECLKWWKENQGSKGPFVHLSFYPPEHGIPFLALPLASDAMTFLVEYLSTAQYLDVDQFTRYLLQQDFNDSGPHSQLQSLSISCPINDEGGDISGWPHLGLFYIAPTLRRLRIHHVEVSPHSYHRRNFTNWSKLTHLSISVVAQLHIWCSLIRGVPNLQWGHFHIWLYLSLDYDPPNFTLPFLSTLSVGATTNSPIASGELLRNLHCPTVHDLSIDVDMGIYSSEIFGAAISINKMLKSAPAVTKLTLGLSTIGVAFGTIPMPTTTTNDEKVKQLSILAPRLTHLLIDMCDVHPIISYETTLSKTVAIWKDLLSPMNWVDITSPASKIRKITAIVKMPSRDTPLVDPIFRGALALEKGDDDADADNVVFEVIQEDRRTASPYAQGWKTWGGSL